MEDSTGIVDMFSQATKYVYMEWLYLLLIYLCLQFKLREFSFLKLRCVVTRAIVHFVFLLGW
jgi:hypothetical protein